MRATGCLDVDLGLTERALLRGRSSLFLFLLAKSLSLVERLDYREYYKSDE